MQLSLITCFHNSTPRLEPYLAALRRLDLSGVEVEILFVDNRSTDATLSLLEKAAVSFSVPVRVLSEPTPGLMFARCTGVKHAQGGRIIFFDDDNEPLPDYVQELLRLERKFPAAALFTGNCRLPQEYRVPASLEGALPLIIIRDLRGEFSYPLSSYSHSHMPWGAGFTAPRIALAEACQTWLTTDKKVVGRTGSKLSGGEDYWLAHFLTRRGEPVVFSETLNLIHRVDPSRLDASYLGRLAVENGLEFLTLLAAIRELKPQLKERMPTATQLWIKAFVGLPLKLGRFLLKPDGTNLAHAASGLGLTLSLLLRQRPSNLDSREARCESFS